MTGALTMTTTTSIDASSVFRRSADVVCRSVGAESILVPIRNNVGNLDYVYTLTPVAARIWALLDGTRSTEAIIQTICEEYDVGVDTARADLETLLSDLAEVSLVSRVS